MKHILCILTFFGNLALAQSGVSTCPLSAIVSRGLDGKVPATHYTLVVSNSKGEIVIEEYITDTNYRVVDLPFGDTYHVMASTPFSPFSPPVGEGSIDTRLGCSEYDDSVWINLGFNDESIENYLFFSLNYPPPYFHYQKNSATGAEDVFQEFIHYLDTIHVLLQKFSLDKTGLTFRIRGCQATGEKSGLALRRATEMKELFVSRLNIAEDQITLEDETAFVLDAANRQNLEISPARMRYVTLSVTYSYSK